jgi:hypothetical protein
MRQRTACAFLAVWACLLASCVYSVHPLDQGKPSVVASNLAGTWTAKDEDGKLELMTIEEPAPGEYEATFTSPDSGRRFRYKVRLARLGELVFADVQLMGEVKGESVEELPVGAAALHMFFKVSLTGDQFGISLIDPQWLKEQFDAHKLSLAHEEFGDSTIILTAQSPQLRTLLLEVGANPKAFPDNALFTRKK